MNMNRGVALFSRLSLFAAVALFLGLFTAGSALAQDLDFEPGAWNAYAYGSYLEDLSEHIDNGFALHGGLGRFFLPGFSVNLELSAFSFIQDGPDAAGFGVALVPRWHFWREEGWTVYVDAGLGSIWADEDVPPGAKQHNFTEFGGLGGTLDLTDSVRLMGGLRYRHISNNNSSDNPGVDSIEPYLGLSFPF